MPNIQRVCTHLATICSIEMPIFIMPLGAMDRRMNSTPKMAKRSIGRAMDATNDAPFAAVGPALQTQYKHTRL